MQPHSPCRTQRPALSLLRQMLIGAFLASGGGLIPAALPLATAQLASMNYDIPAGPLTNALNQFGRQAGVMVSYTPQLTAGLQSPGLQGQYDPSTALHKLLEGTGIQAVPRSEGGYLLRAAPVSATQASQTPTTLQELVIYGDRTTSLSGDSISTVTIIDAQALDSATMQTWRDSFQLVPNASVGDRVESGFIIRGINSEGLTPGGIGAPLASFYIDGVQQTIEGTRRGLRGTFDVEQIEVYRGPQSTLTGRNALAGAVYLRTTDPSFERDIRAQALYGENQHRSVGLAYGDAINDRAAFRVSGEWSRQNTDLNYPSMQRFDRYDDLTSGQYYNLRGKLLLQPTGSQATQVLLSYSHAYDRPLNHNISGSQWSTGAPDYDDKRGDIWGDILPDMYRYGFGLNELPAFQEVRETRVNSLGLEVSHQINDTLKLNAQTGWSRSVTERNSVNYGTPGEFLTTTGEFDQQILSQEIRLNYESDTLRWVGGLYAAQEKQKAFRIAQLISLDHTTNHAKISNLAAFGEVSYEFMPSWRVIVGARADHVRQKQSATLVTNHVAAPETNTRFSDTVLLPKIGLERQFDQDRQRVALVWQEGYRPGGAGIKASNGSQFTYEAERAKNLELSWHGRFLEDRLRMAVNLFYQRWTNQQIELWENPFNAATSYIANAGRSKSYGAEIEASYDATSRLGLYTAIGVLHTKFEDFRIVNNDFSGQPFSNAPEFNMALGFRWGYDKGWFANGNVKFTSSSRSRLEQDVSARSKLKNFTTVNASAGYDWSNGVRLTAYATNLFDRKYFRYESSPNTLANLGERREVGLRLDYAY